jgi:hypothetical protein
MLLLGDLAREASMAQVHTESWGKGRHLGCSQIPCLEP